MQAHPELVLKAIEKNFEQLDLANFENLETQHTGMTQEICAISEQHHFSQPIFGGSLIRLLHRTLQFSGRMYFYS